MQLLVRSDEDSREGVKVKKKCIQLEKENHFMNFYFDGKNFQISGTNFDLSEYCSSLNAA